MCHFSKQSTTKLQAQARQDKGQISKTEIRKEKLAHRGEDKDGNKKKKAK